MVGVRTMTVRFQHGRTLLLLCFSLAKILEGLKIAEIENGTLTGTLKKQRCVNIPKQ